MADTFDAISRDPQALRDTISKQPATLDVATRSLRVQRPFLDHTAAFSRDLRGAVDELPATLPVLNSALRIGTPVQAALAAAQQAAAGHVRRAARTSSRSRRPTARCAA